MVFKSLNQDHFYRISCSDWECVVTSNSKEEAAAKAFKEALKNKDLNISFVAIVDLICESEIKTDFLYVPEILSNLGYFKLAEEISQLSDFFLDKGENSH